jgi:hypothetical protein
MEQTEEYFTLETLIKLYTDAAKAGGIESVCGGYWSKSGGPNLNCKVAHYRLKPVPVVKYVIKYPDGSTSTASFTSESDAEVWDSGIYGPNGKVIKLTEEVS